MNEIFVEEVNKYEQIVNIEKNGQKYEKNQKSCLTYPYGCDIMVKLDAMKAKVAVKQPKM